MATGISLSAADKALHTSSEKANFQRLARLLMCGGLTLLREVFDSIHPPASLPAVLSHPATVRQLNGARLTRAEWEQVYLPSGGHGKSADFDITLLFRLLRTICHLVPPPTGWDCLPPMSVCSLESDLVRIKYYRNNIYGHNQTMEISDDEFVDLWREISEALLRIAESFSRAKRDEWKESVDKFLHDPLTPDAESHVAELQSWYKNDMDTKDEVERLRNKVEQVEQMNINIHTIVESIFTILGGRSICPGNFLNVPHQSQEARLQSDESMCVHIAIPPKQLQDAKMQPESECVPMEQAAERAVGLSTKELQRNEQIQLLFWQWQYHMNKVNEVEEYLRKLGVDIQGNKLGSLVITVSCSSLQVLERLWEDYCSGHLNEVVQQTLVTTEVLEELGLSEVKLKTIISEEEYKAYKEFFMQRSGKIYTVVGS